MVTELVLTFKDDVSDGEEEPLEFVYTLNAPSGFEVTGGQLFIENPSTSDLQRFSFRIDRNDKGQASLVVLEGVKA